MAAIDLKTLTPDTTVPTGAVLFGADSQAAASPSVYPIADVMKIASASTGTAVFDAAKAYVTNDVIINNGRIYRANGAVAAGAFNATQWTEIGAAVGETSAAATIAGGVLNIDCSKDLFTVSLNANITSITFSNIPAAPAVKGVVLEFTCDGTARTITWPASVKWPGGTAPTLTSDAGKKDVFVLVTSDGGASWLAFTGGQKL